MGRGDEQAWTHMGTYKHSIILTLCPSLPSHSLSPASHCPAPLLIAHCRRLLQFGSLYGFLRCVFAYPVRDPKAPTPIASFTAEILRCVRHGRPSDAWALTAAHTNTQQHHTSTAAHTNTPFSRMRCSPFPHLPGSLTAGIQLRRFAHCTDCSVQRSQRCATVIRSQPLSTRDLQTPNGHSHTLTRSHTRSHTHTHSHTHLRFVFKLVFQAVYCNRFHNHRTRSNND